VAQREQAKSSPNNRPTLNMLSNTIYGMQGKKRILHLVTKQLIIQRKKLLYINDLTRCLTYADLIAITIILNK